jgi:hypothetical protein
MPNLIPTGKQFIQITKIADHQLLLGGNKPQILFVMLTHPPINRMPQIRITTIRCIFQRLPAACSVVSGIVNLSIFVLLKYR